MLDFLDKAKKELNALVMYDENREALIKNVIRLIKKQKSLLKPYLKREEQHHQNLQIRFARKWLFLICRM